jgi:hypothetical protein
VEQGIVERLEGWLERWKKYTVERWIGVCCLVWKVGRSQPMDVELGHGVGDLGER